MKKCPIKCKFNGWYAPSRDGSKNFEKSGDLSKKNENWQGGRREEVRYTGERMGENGVNMKKQQASEYPEVMQEIHSRCSVGFGLMLYN